MKDYKTLYGSLVTGDWPATSPKNASGPSASDGTPFSRDLIADIWGARIDLMVLAGLTPDGVEEANGSSQFVKSLHRAIRGPGEFVLSALNATERALRRLIVCSGQTIAIASYAPLVAATYCGDANNATAPAFYKTSDSGGTTRSTSGAYFVLPDCRGLVPRGINSNTKITAVNGSVYTGGMFVGELMNDMIFGHKHGITGPSGVIGSNNITITTGGGATSGIPADSSHALLGSIAISVPLETTFGVPNYGFETAAASFGAEICLSC
jgi:hypothetical protein